MHFTDTDDLTGDAFAWARLHKTLPDSVDGLGSTRIPADHATIGASPRRTPGMMEPSRSAFLVGFTLFMLDRRDRIGFACLWTGVAMIVMIAGRMLVAKIEGRI